MIGGYLYQTRDANIEKRLAQKLLSYNRADLWDIGCLFHSNPFQVNQKSFAAAPGAAVVTEDLLVGEDGDSGYRLLDLETDILPRFGKDPESTFDGIQSDFTMAVVSRDAHECALYMASNRAGSGRIYYHQLPSGILLSSDLRFLLSIIPLDVNPLAIYSILKYGSIMPPLTISRNISVVPAAHYGKYDLRTGELSVRPFYKFKFPCEIGNGAAGLDGAKTALKKSADLLGRYPTAMLLSGGIDSSLYGCYMSKAARESIRAFYCSFGTADPEAPFASAIAGKIGVALDTFAMGKADALQALDDVARMTDHPFSDFSSLPISFLLKSIRERLGRPGIVIECNGGDDCFGFSYLQDESKFRAKHMVPRPAKKLIAKLLEKSSCWKWESHQGAVARIAALADVHERSYLDYFLVQAPVHYLALEAPAEWDERLGELIEQGARSCSEDAARLSYRAKTTVRQLLYVNSARWAAKALSVGEGLGLRVLYPYIWRDVLEEQGKLPWSLKIRNGTVKWPLKKLLEEFMPADFIYRQKSGFVPPFVQWLTDAEFNSRVCDILKSRNAYIPQVIPLQVLEELLTDARNGKRLRFPVLNMLWGAIFAEAWIQRNQRDQQANWPTA